jgi:transposase
VETGTVEYVGEERKQASLAAYYQTLSAAQRAGLEAIAMDMWEPYVQATRAHVPDAEAKIVFDRFHVMTQLGKAVDTVRKQEHRARLAQGDATLTGTKYLGLYSRENLPAAHRRAFQALRRLELKVGRAWAIKETLRQLWRYRYPGGWRTGSGGAGTSGPPTAA